MAPLLSFSLIAPGLGCLALATSTISAQVRTRETSNGCKSTSNDPCTRSGTCNIQRSTWSQRVVCSRIDRHATMGRAGLCDPALVGLGWAAQGLVMSSHTDLSSAVRGTVQAPLGGN